MTTTTSTSTSTTSTTTSRPAATTSTTTSSPKTTSTTTTTVPPISASGAIPSDRTIDWTYAGVPGGIPRRTQICKSLGVTGQPATFVQSVTAAQINSAIAACGAEQVVFLNAGTYNIGQINLASHSHVTLRGAGPGKTIIKSSAGLTAIVTDEYSFAGGAAIRSGYTKGSTSVVLAAAADPQVSAGNLILFDENDDTSLVLSSQGPGRHMKFSALVTGVSGSTVSFTPPLPFTLSSSLVPKLSFLNGGPGASWDGIEDMTIANNGGNDIIAFWGTYACWVKDVELTGLENTGVFPVDSLNFEVRDSYIHAANHFPNNPDGYGVYLYDGTTYALVENNTFEKIGIGVLQTASSANAILYNYTTWMDFQGWPYQTGGFNSNHGAHPMMVLWEGNIGEQWQDDGYHGNSSHQTLFRNWFHGLDPATNGGNRKMISIERGGYYHNVIGNILGDASWTSYPGFAYEMSGEPGYTEAAVIFRLGYPNVANNGFDAANPWPYPLVYPDAKVKSTLYRHGNFDYFNNSVVWDPAVSDHALPKSLYHPAKPSWFGSLQWPPIGPDVPGKAGDIPAKYCYERGLMPGCLAGP